MAGHLPSSISYAMTRALPSLSSSQRLPESLEDSHKRVGIIRVIGRKMKKHSYFQSTENRFTGSKMLRRLSFVVPVGALALEGAHYKYSEIHLTKRMLDGAKQTGKVMAPTTE
jgi:hypothetical protein